MALAEFTREAIDAANLSFQEFKFSKDQKTFTFEYKDKIYEYNRLTRKLKELKAENDIQKKEEEEPIYSWMNFSPDKKYLLYAKNHNLYMKGNKKMGVDTTEVQLTFDGVENYSYARSRGEEYSRIQKCQARHAGVKIAAMPISF